MIYNMLKKKEVLFLEWAARKTTNKTGRNDGAVGFATTPSVVLIIIEDVFFHPSLIASFDLLSVCRQMSDEENFR